MRRSTVRMLLFLLVLTLVAGFIAWPTNREIDLTPLGIEYRRDISVRQGLDLQGGMQVLLQADVPAGTSVDPDVMIAARQIVESRVNALGVAEPAIQLAENNRIIVELPGVRDPDQAIATFGSTGLLEFIDAGAQPLPVGALAHTSLGPPPMEEDPAPPAEGATPTPEPTVFRTVMEGRHLQTASVAFDEVGRTEISFTLTGEGGDIFGDFTTNNVNRFLAITLDKQVMSSPRIESPILGGTGRITGGGPRGFPLEEARSIVIQLKYGALPVPLKIVQNRTVGPTLGQDSVQKSIVAGAVGLSLVAVFMLLYYRVPGLIAVLALTIYAAIVFSLFKLIPVVLTVAGIAGFILSVGMAVDANILIFERIKEELRAGRSMAGAIDAGFARAWTSIRDSNVSTLITCAILFWFGATFGASIIQGFALTLAIGVLVSMFTAITATRTFLRALESLGGLPVRFWSGVAARPARA